MADQKDSPGVAPSVRYTRPRSRDYADPDARLRERQVAVANPDGSVTVHTFWTDTHTA